MAPSLAFLFSSTNLVVELGIILYLLMGWQFTVAEWIGGVVLVAIISVLVKLTYPKKLVEEARAHEETGGGHEHGSETVEGATLWQKLRNPRTRILVAQSVTMDWSMLWKDVIGGFLIAGFLAVFVPPHVWKTLFLAGAPAAVQIPANAIAGAVIAILTFVCSIGNVPMAAILWGTGISFGGVLAFLYADLIVVPLLDVYPSITAGRWRRTFSLSSLRPWLARRCSWMSFFRRCIRSRNRTRTCSRWSKRSRSTTRSGSTSLRRSPWHGSPTSIASIQWT